MDVPDPYKLWADAHVFFGGVPVGVPGDPVTSAAMLWEQRLAEETPNGHLMRSNGLFDALAGHGKLHLLHVTNSLEQINRQGVLYPSGGCLLGSVYCAPLTQVDDGFRMHNLGEYVLTREAPAFLARRGISDRTPAPLIFEIDVPPQAYRGLAGVDYLRLGSIHLRIYSHLEYLLSKAERHQLKETVVARVKNSAAFIALACTIAHQGVTVSTDRFLRALHEAIPRMPILGYLYFEVLSEYLMLHSTSERTRRLAEIGEFNNWIYKEVLFASSRGMTGKFDLSRFQPSPEGLARLLADVDPTVSPDRARTYVVDRMSLLVASHFLNPGTIPDAWHHLRWEFDSLTTRLGPLLGHLIHRELRSFGRYPDFYFYFDQYKALQAWNYWNHMDIVVPFNGTIPKGEVGINPAYPDLQYRVLRAETDDRGLLHPTEQLDLTIAPRLVDIKHSLMRNSQWASSTPSVA